MLQPSRALLFILVFSIPLSTAATDDQYEKNWVCPPIKAEALTAPFLSAKESFNRLKSLRERQWAALLKRIFNPTIRSDEEDVESLPNISVMYRRDFLKAATAVGASLLLKPGALPTILAQKVLDIPLVVRPELQSPLDAVRGWLNQLEGTTSPANTLNRWISGPEPSHVIHADDGYFYPSEKELWTTARDAYVNEILARIREEKFEEVLYAECKTRHPAGAALEDRLLMQSVHRVLRREVQEFLATRPAATEEAWSVLSNAFRSGALRGRLIESVAREQASAIQTQPEPPSENRPPSLKEKISEDPFVEGPAVEQKTVEEIIGTLPDGRSIVIRKMWRNDGQHLVAQFYIDEEKIGSLVASVTAEHTFELFTFQLGENPWVKNPYTGKIERDVLRWVFGEAKRKDSQLRTFRGNVHLLSLLEALAEEDALEDVTVVEHGASMRLRLGAELLSELALGSGLLGIQSLQWAAQQLLVPSAEYDLTDPLALRLALYHGMPIALITYLHFISTESISSEFNDILCEINARFKSTPDRIHREMDPHPATNKNVFEAA